MSCTGNLLSEIRQPAKQRRKRLQAPICHLTTRVCGSDSILDCVTGRRSHRELPKIHYPDLVPGRAWKCPYAPVSRESRWATRGPTSYGRTTCQPVKQIKRRQWGNCLGRTGPRQLTMSIKTKAAEVPPWSDSAGRVLVLDLRILNQYFATRKTLSCNSLRVPPPFLGTPNGPQHRKSALTIDTSSQLFTIYLDISS